MKTEKTIEMIKDTLKQLIGVQITLYYIETKGMSRGPKLIERVYQYKIEEDGLRVYLYDKETGRYYGGMREESLTPEEAWEVYIKNKRRELTRGFKYNRYIGRMIELAEKRSAKLKKKNERESVSSQKEEIPKISKNKNRISKKK
jgi:hypothetical protein